MGAPASVADAFEKVWEGHLRQFGRARIPAVELAKDGIFVKEFPPSFDWEHTGEGLQAFYWDGLGRPNDHMNAARARRFAGFYLNEDPGAPNYDPKLKIIKSLFNGSKGPVTRPVTPVDWDGDENPKRAARFSTSSNIRGDHPLNLLATTLSTQAYLLTHEPKYKRWVLEYVDAWRDRAAANGGNFPSNIGLDGKIGGEWGGKWYGGIFGWNSPDDGLRNYVLRGIPGAFGQAAMLSKSMAYIDPVRRQVDNIFAAARTENSELLAGTVTGRESFIRPARSGIFRRPPSSYTCGRRIPPTRSVFFPTRQIDVQCRDGSSFFREKDRITRSRRYSRNVRTPPRRLSVCERRKADTVRARSRSSRLPTSR
jgi:hypothetical protein